MRIGTVAQLWRYPVKSMGGERREAAVLTQRGIPGDRGWAVYDEARGGITNAKRLPLLRDCRARYLREPVAGAGSPPVEITLPDGTSFSSDAASAGRRLSEFLGRAVSLRSLGPVGTESAPRITAGGDPPDTLRALMGLLPDEPMPDFSEFPAERLRRLRHDNFFDALPLHLLTRTTLQTLARLAPDSRWDERRFRSNVFVAAITPDGYPELAWIRRRVRVGCAVLEVVAGCPRCVMVTQRVDELPQDHRTMRTLVRETKHTAGVYAGVIEEGETKVGDEIALSE